ncbi:MAG: bifunctional oligoribonuclease/PAP phosphatase NrnA [Oscillospiraceae bacterium]|nr:bifunctional oligoribonuclease/PAP phosphatase NrnA [Oscillospiraceae bacterium]
MRIDIAKAAGRLQSAEAVRVLTHQHPDGDTLGSAYALAYALRTLGKRACVLCEDAIPADYAFITEDWRADELAHGLVAAVDVADERLLGKGLAARFAGRVDLCVDHHPTNSLYAAETLLEPKAAACAELVLLLIDALGVPLDEYIAACIYTGITTDTGCFRYANTTARTHRLAARCMERGISSHALDTRFFETKTRSYAALERMALDQMRDYCAGRVALTAVTQAMFRESGSNEDEYIRICALPRQIEGVLVGVSVRERADGVYKISLRSNGPIDASAIAARMGGGGHFNAAGCESELGLEETIEKIIGYIEEALP